MNIVLLIALAVVTGVAIYYHDKARHLQRLKVHAPNGHDCEFESLELVGYNIGSLIMEAHGVGRTSMTFRCPVCLRFIEVIEVSGDWLMDGKIVLSAETIHWLRVQKNLARTKPSNDKRS